MWRKGLLEHEPAVTAFNRDCSCDVIGRAAELVDVQSSARSLQSNLINDETNRGVGLKGSPKASRS